MMLSITPSWRRVAATVLAITALLLPTATAQEQAAEAPAPTQKPFLWRFEVDGTTHHLFGTIHLPDPRVTTLSKAVESARAAADALYVEVLTANKNSLALMPKLMLPRGESLEEILGEELLEEVQAYCEGAGLPFQAMRRFKPWVLSMNISLGEVMMKFQGKDPLDVMLERDAREAEKVVGELETMEFQLSLFDKLTEGYQKQMVQSALEEAGNGSETIEQMLNAYLLGDAEALAAVMEKSQRKESKEYAEKFRELLIVARNKGMAKRILELLKEHPKRGHFFAVGAAHTFGEDGIVDLLREQGVKVERLNGAGDVVAEPAPKKPAEEPVERRKAG
jgi:uncharacterized protein YbaP (TraB family)